MSTAIWWVRKDLRLGDNPALQAALAAGRGVIPVFILDEHLLEKPAPKRQAFLMDGLRALAVDLESRGSRLIVRQGEAQDVLRELMSETGAEVLFAEEDYSPYARSRDQKVEAALPLQLVVGATVQHPATVHKADGAPYTVFTPFSKAWKNLPQPGSLKPAPASLPPVPGDLASLPIPHFEPVQGFAAGEAEALRRLEAFLQQLIETYSDDRNRFDLPGTSMLSPYLRFGMLSARQAVLVARAASGAGRDTWINELIWREFYQAILYYFPHVLKQAFNPAMRSIPWRDDPAALQAWQQGQTGYPIVDASMRQLAATGWMHNRGRMITASFLVKDLLINWQEGERWFMQHLVDGDPASNNGGWQWAAGTGTDAAPYFRIFSPILQSQKFDPQGAFIRKWIPELRAVPDAYIHTPWLMAPPMQQTLGVRIGTHYPAPIVDHASIKERTLAAYAASKNQNK